MNKQVILTGIRANNDLHIGNYFGALLPLVDMTQQHGGDFEVDLMLADLHSFITPVNHADLQPNINASLKNYVAAGLPLDNPSVRLFRQSYVPAHSELTWILDCFTGFGEMSRMTQFKDKSAKLSADRVSLGLFNYPVLMAADILLYGAEYVPVGDDQTQHLEFTRDIAERFNKQFAAQFPNGVFKIPLPVPKQHEFFGKDQGLRIKDLQDPSKKMSKSDASGKGVIFLGDDPAAAAKKIMSATTDSAGKIAFDPQNQPGIANLLQILALLTGREQADVTQQWAGKTSYGELKTAVAKHMQAFLQTFQARLVLVDDSQIQNKLSASEKLMNQQANATLRRAQQAVGLRALEVHAA